MSSGDITSRPGAVSSHDLVLCEFHKRFILFCEFCVKDLFVLLPDLLLVVFKQPLAQVAHLLQCKRRLVLPRGTWWGAGSVEGRTGAGGITGATGLSLVEGPFQLPPPLDPAVLLTEVLEDLLWSEPVFASDRLRGHRMRWAVDWGTEVASLRGRSAGSPR